MVDAPANDETLAPVVRTLPIPEFTPGIAFSGRAIGWRRRAA